MKTFVISVLLACFCIFWLADLCQGNSDPLTRHGTPDELMEVSADEILNAIAAARDVDIEYATIRGDLSIMKVAGRLQQEGGKPAIKSSIGIRFCRILGDVAFSSARFDGNVSFVSSVFQRHADFSFVNFAYGASFGSVTFDRNSSFISASFDGDADFDRVAFGGDAIFTAANFSGNAIFNSAIFSADVVFNGASFGESARFLRTRMEYPALFTAVKFHENTTIPGLWNNILCPILRTLTIGLWKPSPKIITDFSDFNTNVAMDPSSNPYLKRYIEDEQWILSWRETAWWREPAFFIWEITSHCGRSIVLWTFWAGLIALGFAIIYRRFLSDSIGFNAEKLKDVKPGFRGYLYYSMVTLTTLGFGDIIPLTNKARLVVGTEVGVGYLMLGGLISIFANKLARRS